MCSQLAWYATHIGHVQHSINVFLTEFDFENMYQIKIWSYFCGIWSQIIKSTNSNFVLRELIL